MTSNSRSKFLAMIPARGGSKGLPRKNIKLLKNKPMIAYTIEAAILSMCFSKIIVSTEDPQIAEIAKNYGAEVPFFRPALLANDGAMTVDVVLHAIDFFEQRNIFFDAIMILQPTSPLRNDKDILNATKLFTEKNANSVISVCEADHSPLWMNTLPEDKNLENFLNKEIINKRRQDLPIYYRLNGAIYLVKTEFIKTNKSFYDKNSYAYIMPRDRSVDIDNAIDFNFCETLLNIE